MRSLRTVASVSFVSGLLACGADTSDDAATAVTTTTPSSGGSGGASAAGGSTAAGGASNGGGGGGSATTSVGGAGGGAAGGAGGGATTSDPGPCKHDGGLSCGGNGIAGDPNTLYVCANGAWTVDHVCGGPCEPMPSGVPDRCASDVVVPQSLIDALTPTPYVEDSCKPTTWKGWPYDAQKCTYSSGGLTATVTVANPSAERVATWIVDASVFVPQLWRARLTNKAAWEKGLIEFAKHTLGQSSRIFPLEGGIIEDMSGNGAVNYPFFKGVTQGCSSGCYCRINSLHRTEWCTYKAFLGPGTYDDCIATVGDSGLTDGWGNECLQNHIDAWQSPKNEHYRAMAHRVQGYVAKHCPKGACTPAQVAQAVHDALAI